VGAEAGEEVELGRKVAVEAGRGARHSPPSEAATGSAVKNGTRIQKARAS